MPVPPRSHGPNSLSRTQTAKFPKGGFLLKILKMTFRKINKTIDNRKAML